MGDPVYAPRSAAGRAGLQAVRTGPAGALVAVDFDGTLAEIVGDPTAARPVPGAVDALTALARRCRTVAVLTGRPAGTLVEYAGLAAHAGTDGLVVLGHYGDERWDAATDTYTQAPAPAGLAAARAALPELLRDLGSPTGVFVEEKGTSVAVHVRAAAEPHGLFVRLAAPLQELAARTGLMVQPGRFVHELRSGASDKGTALRDVAAALPAASVLYAGDDLGDLPAFEVVEVLRNTGVPGLTVACRGPEPVPEVTDRADLVLDGPQALVTFLRTLLA
ncbi:MAG: trehalose-phosphatase [Streptosporangiales bacterium]|nr:trehalose-phosphatase [Streptosporangiales bacterium]